MARDPTTRDQLREWQREISPGTGLGARFDRGAWAAAGQRNPREWSWPRALMQIALTVALLLGLVLFLDVQVTTLIGATIGYSLLIVRAHHLHRRFVTRR